MSHFNLRENLIERRNVEVDPERAKHYLKFNTYEVQRTLRPGHVDELAEKMKDGRFRFGEIAFGVLNGADIMMNGQHQCNAIIQSGETVPCVFEKYRCSSKMDLADMFRQFENFGRSLDDFIKAKAGALNLKWPNRIANVVVAAAAVEYAMKNSRKAHKLKGHIRPATQTSMWAKNPLTKERRANLLEQYLKEGNFVYRVLTHIDDKILPGSPSVRHLVRAPVVYVMFLTVRKNEKEALTFWTNVRDGEVLTRDMPEMKLREFLKSVNSHVTTYSQRTVTNHEYICRCIIAWNSFRSKTPTRLAYNATKDIPSVR